MVASLLDIREWFNEGVKDEKKFMIVVYDSIGGHDYPVYVDTEEELHKTIRGIHVAPHSRLMEVYDLSKDRTIQLQMDRCLSIPPKEENESNEPQMSQSAENPPPESS